jgi:hypothetical protein
MLDVDNELKIEGAIKAGYRRMNISPDDESVADSIGLLTRKVALSDAAVVSVEEIGVVIVKNYGKFQRWAKNFLDMLD